MKLHELKPAKGSVKTNKRLGRGQGSGKGGTASRGHNGQKSRSGYSRKRAFEGGQMPLQMRLPKRGFKNPNRTDYVVFNLKRLSEIAEKYDATTIDFDFLRSNGFVKKTDQVKILANGELTSALNVSAHKFSAKASEAITAKGGEITTL